MARISPGLTQADSTSCNFWIVFGRLCQVAACSKPAEFMRPENMQLAKSWQHQRQEPGCPFASKHVGSCTGQASGMVQPSLGLAVPMLVAMAGSHGDRGVLSPSRTALCRVAVNAEQLALEQAPAAAAGRGDSPSVAQAAAAWG